jgi:hypothetical protein
MYECVIGKLKLSNLVELLSEGNTQAVYTRMEIINYSKSVLNMMVLGPEEDFIRDSANLTGIPLIMDRFQINLSAVSGIPVTLLFGRSPAGENSTGESDTRAYYDSIKSKQKNWLQAPLQTLINHINTYLKVVAIEDTALKFNGVWEPTESEVVNMRKAQAEIDAVYITNGVVTPEEVAESRFANGYSFETKIEAGTERGFVPEPEKGIK